ncbi:MAG: hypothetical protein J6U43_01475 [Bacteroidales bacterium]|nr:hypothetical protein [Bacteroidales bacterium]
MKRLAIASILLLLPLLWVACSTSSSDTQYPDDEDILYIETDSLRAENSIEIEQMSRHSKLSKGYRRTFNDKNNVHLAMAMKYGIEPLQSLEDANSRTFFELAKVDSCQYYSIKRLTHSAPYLTPRSKWMLMTIGKNFQDSLASQHGVEGYQIIVTSLLRTDDSIRRLRRRNSNASKNSAHRYGTTIDISYIHYNRTDSAKYIPEYRLKETLAEVLYDLRREGRCYIKYEVKQSCFHVTIW